MSPAACSYLKNFALWTVPLAVLACGEGGTDVVLPSLRVTTATTGVEIDPDGYDVSIDDQAPQPLGTNAILVAERLAEGEHSVELTGVAGNCSVSGDNPRAASVVPLTTATTAFVVTCSATTGSAHVVTTTTGSGTDPDGFVLLLDGAEHGIIGVNESNTLALLAAGSHTIGLTGLAANCVVSGENPRAVTVPGGGTVEVSFAVACSAPAPGSGTVQVVTSISGSGTDPDGFSLLFDGADRGPLTGGATSSLAGVTPGSHTIGVAGLAGNCTISGENPRAISVPAGGTVQVAFAVTCSVPGPTTGTLTVTTVTTGPASALDADGYLLSVNGGPDQPIGTSATVSLANLPAAEHTVELRGLAANCSITGDNPLGAAVSPGGVARVSFAVTCVATVGGLRVTVTGLPGSVAAAVTVTGPNSFSQNVTETRTLSALVPGTYTVAASDVVTGGNSYVPSVGRPSVPIAAGATATVTVSYTPAVVVPTLNLRIDGLHLTQSTQTYTSSVPLVAGRDGYLRVFLVANESNTAMPQVRVRVSSPGASRTFAIQAPTPVPQQVSEGTLGSSWNVPVPGSLIQSGLTIMAELDPENEIPEANEGDNRFPASGTKALTVRSVPAARIRFVSVQQGSSPPGDVSSPGRLVDLTRSMHPLNAVEVDARAGVFTASEPLLANGSGWDQVLGDLDALRLTEPDGVNRIYFGLAKLEYGRGQGLVGNAFTGQPQATTALGSDDHADVNRVVAHELGHIWGRRHAPCGSPPDVDGIYPYSGGLTGVYGLDVERSDLKPRTSPDIMGYCFAGPWISDYTYQGVMSFRQANVPQGVASTVQPSLLIWGRIVNGRPVLEPAFHLVTRASLPSRPGPYSVSATSVDGSRLFTLSFDVKAAEDNPGGAAHFAFAVPLDQADALRLGNLRLDGPTGSITSSPPLALVRAPGSSGSVVAVREGGNVSLRWDAAVHPMIMVRDPDTKEVLAFARGGRAVVRTSKGELLLDISDGLRSQRLRLAINRS